MFAMFGRLAPDSAGGMFSPQVWAAGIEAAVLVAILVVAFSRASHEGVIGTLARAMLVLAGATIALFFVDEAGKRDIAFERQALEARAVELATHVALPISPLACLDGAAGDMVESGCEKALFVNPETTAAAINYVSMQLALLADYRDHLRRLGTAEPPSFINLRRSAEADRYGVVAQVLAAREGCTPTQCPAFALLRNSTRVIANMSDRTFEFNVAQYAGNWPTAGKPPLASAAAATPPSVGGRIPSGELFFPSSASIPPVSIMTPEPTGAESPGTTSGTAAKQAPGLARKPAPPAVQSRTPLDLSVTRVAPSSPSSAQ